MVNRPPPEGDESGAGAPLSDWTRSRTCSTSASGGFGTALTRAGLLALAAALFFMFSIFEAPFTLEVSAWYAARAVPVLVALVALALYGFHTSLAGKPLFGRPLIED